MNVFADIEQYGLLYGINLGGQVTGESTGYFVELDVEKTWVFDNKFVVSPGAALNLASEGFVESYFGVDGEQSAASGNSEFEPSAGIKSAGLNLGFVYLYSQKWSIVGGVEYERYLGDIADSPVTDNENQVTLVLGIAYQL